jgi:hypothetical protein
LRAVTANGRRPCAVRQRRAGARLYRDKLRSGNGGHAGSAMATTGKHPPIPSISSVEKNDIKPAKIARIIINMQGNFVNIYKRGDTKEILESGLTHQESLDSKFCMK